MGEHFRVLCSVCNTMISQCRCSSPTKTTRYEVCSSCKKQGKTAPDSEPLMVVRAGQGAQIAKQVDHILLPGSRNPNALVSLTFTEAENLSGVRGPDGKLTIYRVLPFGAEPRYGYEPVPGLNFSTGSGKVPSLGKPIKLVPREGIGNCVTDGSDLYYVPQGRSTVLVHKNYYPATRGRSAK